MTFQLGDIVKLNKEKWCIYCSNEDLPNDILGIITKKIKHHNYLKCLSYEMEVYLLNYSNELRANKVGVHSIDEDNDLYFEKI